jgi:hypothetical protein
MILSPFTPTLNYGQLINRASPLNRSLAGAWLALPQGGKSNTWFDSHGTNHGTISGNPVWGGLGAPGKLTSLKFDGTGDLVRTGYAPGSAIAGDFTMIGVLNQSSRTGEQVHIGFQTTGGNGFGTEEVEVANVSSGTPRAMYDVTASVISLADYTLDAWHHVALTKIGTTFSAYVDGRLQGSITVVAIATTNTQTFIMGGSDTGIRRYVGSIAAAFVLTRGYGESEVKDHFSETCRGYPTVLNRIRMPLVNSAGAVAGDAVPQVWAQYRARRVA